MIINAAVSMIRVQNATIVFDVSIAKPSFFCWSIFLFFVPEYDRISNHIKQVLITHTQMKTDTLQVKFNITWHTGD